MYRLICTCTLDGLCYSFLGLLLLSCDPFIWFQISSGGDPTAGAQLCKHTLYIDVYYMRVYTQGPNRTLPTRMSKEIPFFFLSWLEILKINEWNGRKIFSFLNFPLLNIFLNSPCGWREAKKRLKTIVVGRDQQQPHHHHQQQWVYFGWGTQKSRWNLHMFVSFSLSLRGVVCAVCCVLPSSW
jgi:hypothetical protein